MGTSQKGVAESHPLKDHPHAYGDKTLNLNRKICNEGSSPRVWGQVVVVVDTPAVFGIIPTRMGTSEKAWNMVLSPRDHPHAYGDKYFLQIILAVLLGSSPRVWGQVTRYLHMLKDSGIIPTRMGTSQKGVAESHPLKDHPHAYGDKFLYQKAQQFWLGSSPRVWGQAEKEKMVTSVTRIIPTRMGTREKGKNTLFVIKDHPHAYGDKALYDKFKPEMSGSSPRVWGQEYLMSF